VGSYVISRHLPICKNGKKDINSIINQCPSIGRIGRRLREDEDETGIVRWLPGLVGGFLITREEDRLRGQRPA